MANILFTSTSPLAKKHYPFFINFNIILFQIKKFSVVYLIMHCQSTQKKLFYDSLKANSYFALIYELLANIFASQYILLWLTNCKHIYYRVIYIYSRLLITSQYIVRVNI